MGRYSTFGARKKSVYKSHDHAILSGIEYSPPGTQPVTQPGTQPGTPPGTPATPAMVAATPAVVAVTTAAALLTPKTAMIKELTKQVRGFKRKASEKAWKKSVKHEVEVRCLKQQNRRLKDQLGAAQKLQQGGEAYKAFLTSFLVPLNEEIESILLSLLEVGILDESTVESLRAGIQDRRSGNLMSKVEGYVRTLWGIMTFQNQILPRTKAIRSSRPTQGKVEGAAIYDAAMDAPGLVASWRSSSTASSSSLYSYAPPCRHSLRPR